MASIIISSRVKPLLSDDDRFELKLHSANKIDETITIISDGDLFTFSVLKNSDRDSDTFINILYSSSSCRIELNKISELEYQITQIFTKLGDPANAELFKSEPEIESKPEIPSGSVVNPKTKPEESIPEKPNCDCESCNHKQRAPSKAAGCSFKDRKKTKY